MDTFTELMQKAGQKIKSMDPNLNYQQIELIYYQQNRSTAHKEKFQNLEKIFGERQIQKMVLEIWQSKGLPVQDSFEELDECYGTLFEEFGIDIEAIEEKKGDYIISDIGRKIALKFFNHIKNDDSTQPQKRTFEKEDLDKFLSKENIDFFNNYPNWINWIKEKVNADQNSVISLSLSCQTNSKRIELLRKAYDEFLAKFEKWDAKQGNLVGKSHLLDTERAIRDSNIDPNDKKTILSNITAEVQVVQMLTGSGLILSQIFISYLKRLYQFISYLSFDLDKIFSVIIESYRHKGGYNYQEITNKEKENFQYL